MTQEELDALMAESEIPSPDPAEEEKEQDIEAENDTQNLETSNESAEEVKSEEVKTDDTQEIEASNESAEEADQNEAQETDNESQEVEELDELEVDELDDSDIQNLQEQTEESLDVDVEDIDAKKIDPSSATPPPANDENKVVSQLDDVTKESEEKASEVFDKLDEISLIVSNISNAFTEQQSIIEKNIDIFKKLGSKFESIEIFSDALKENEKLLERKDEIESELAKIDQMINDTMNIMQYQDIHRQKIERVVNVVRALSHYMQTLFSSNVQDEHRATTAITIDSDNSVSEDELEALLESFGKKS